MVVLFCLYLESIHFIGHLYSTAIHSNVKCNLKQGFLDKAVQHIASNTKKLIMLAVAKSSTHADPTNDFPSRVGG